jgi:putative ubiquitin-RnfH superfamily antitoxin RatB of RatAB toxin-antitoxin module
MGEMMSENMITVEVAYALPKQQTVLQLKVPEGTTLIQAVEQSGIVQRFPEIDPAKNKMGIYGKAAKPDAVLRDLDRVEIYRPLIANPKEVRKKNAAEKETAEA